MLARADEYWLQDEVATAFRRPAAHVIARFRQQPWFSPPCVLGVASAHEGEGRSSLAHTLVGALEAEFGHEVVLFDVDSGSVAPTARMSGGRAFRGPLPDQEFDLELYDWNSRPAGSVSLASGGQAGPACPFEGISEHRASNGISALRDRFDYVVVDLPPLTGDIPGELLLRHLDGVMLVIRAGISSVADVETACGLLGSQLLKGVVLVGGRSAVPGFLDTLFEE